MNTHSVGVEVLQHDDDWNLQLSDGLLCVNHTGSYNIRVQHLPFLIILQAQRGGRLTVGVITEGVVTVGVVRLVSVVSGLLSGT